MKNKITRKELPMEYRMRFENLEKSSFFSTWEYGNSKRDGTLF